MNKEAKCALDTLRDLVVAPPVLEGEIESKKQTRAIYLYVNEISGNIGDDYTVSTININAYTTEYNIRNKDKKLLVSAKIVGSGRLKIYTEMLNSMRKVFIKVTNNANVEIEDCVMDNVDIRAIAEDSMINLFQSTILDGSIKSTQCGVTSYINGSVIADSVIRESDITESSIRKCNIQECSLYTFSALNSNIKNKSLTGYRLKESSYISNHAKRVSKNALHVLGLEHEPVHVSSSGYIVPDNVHVNSFVTHNRTITAIKYDNKVVFDVGCQKGITAKKFVGRIFNGDVCQGAKIKISDILGTKAFKEEWLKISQSLSYSDGIVKALDKLIPNITSEEGLEQARKLFKETMLQVNLEPIFREEKKTITVYDMYKHRNNYFDIIKMCLYTDGAWNINREGLL